MVRKLELTQMSHLHSWRHCSNVIKLTLSVVGSVILDHDRHHVGVFRFDFIPALSLCSCMSLEGFSSSFYAVLACHVREEDKAEAADDTPHDQALLWVHAHVVTSIAVAVTIAPVATQCEVGVGG